MLVKTLNKHFFCLFKHFPGPQINPMETNEAMVYEKPLMRGRRTVHQEHYQTLEYR